MNEQRTDDHPDRIAGLADRAIGTRRPVHLWLIGLFALVWNAGSAIDYVLTQSANPAYLSNFTTDQLSYFGSFPVWVDVGWAFAVWGGLIGSLLLLLRKKSAVAAFLLSLIGMVMTGVWQFALAPVGPADIMGTAAVVMTALIWIVAIGLAAYAIDMARRGILH